MTNHLCSLFWTFFLHTQNKVVRKNILDVLKFHLYFSQNLLILSSKIIETMLLSLFLKFNTKWPTYLHMHKHTQKTNIHNKLIVYLLLLKAMLSTHIHRYIKPKPNASVGGKTSCSFLPLFSHNQLTEELLKFLNFSWLKLHCVLELLVYLLNRQIARFHSEYSNLFHLF